ncbi:kinase-like domain-containing protein [Phycomyces nitens]|nr:kinase-like domain-containing protein [Phycomyces nitens]
MDPTKDKLRDENMRRTIQPDVSVSSRISMLQSTLLSLTDKGTPDTRDTYDTAKLNRASTSSLSIQSLIRPPKSPLRPGYQPNEQRSMLYQKSLESTCERSRRPTSVHESPSDHSMTASMSLCVSSVKQPKQPAKPSPKNERAVSVHGSLTSTKVEPTQKRRQSVSLPHSTPKDDSQNPNDPKNKAPATGSLGHKLDRKVLNTVNAVQEDDPTRKQLSLKSKDGSTSTTYQLGNCIGKGQFGSVYRALDLATGEIVAIKRINLDDEGVHDQEMMKEVSLLQTLSHTNVIQYLGFIRTEEHLNIILEFAENGSLMSTSKAFGAFPEKLVASFCVKILSGLEYLHANEVVHCDLKAANILTTKTGDVKLTDFGVSLNLKIKGADAGTVSGTPNWMAPEVIELKGASTKADIWSLGCTLVELVTGKPPYSDLIAMSAMFRIVEDEYPPLPENVSMEMQDFLVCCFQKDPKDRPTASQLKEHVWIKNNHKEKSTESIDESIEEEEEDEGEELPQLRPDQDQDRMDTNTIHSFACALSDSAIENGSVPSFVYSLSESERGESRFSVTEDDHETHRFIRTSFGKDLVECKVCKDLMTERAIFCEVCALICHEDCKRLAFSCPPAVNDHQPSYDVYNRSQERRPSLPGTLSRHQSKCVERGKGGSVGRNPSPPLQNHPQAESIRKYSKALGLTPQEQMALSANPALLSHTLAMEKIACLNPIEGDKLTKRRLVGKKMNLHTDEQCIIT